MRWWVFPSLLDLCDRPMMGHRLMAYGNVWNPDILLFGLPCLDWIGFTGGDGVSTALRIVFLTSLIAWMLENHHTAFMGVLPKLWKLSLNASSAGGLTWDAFRNISQGSMTHWCSNSGDNSNVWFCKSWLHFSKVLKCSSISAIIDCSAGVEKSKFVANLIITCAIWQLPDFTWN